MHRRNTRVRPRFHPGLERAEQRNLPGTLGLPFNIGAIIGRLGPIKDFDAKGRAQLIAALQGGAGEEFRQLIQRQVRNPLRIISEFASGKRTSFTMPGFAARTPKLLESYEGTRLDQWNPMVAGAVVLANGKLSLAAIMRGPIDRPEPVRYVWAFDTGRGAEAVFPEVPKIKADTLVIVERSQAGGVHVSVRDLVSDTSKELSSKLAKFGGPTVRLKLNPATDFPSGGKPITQATFAFWTQSSDGGLETVGQFVPNANIKVGSLKRR